MNIVTIVCNVTIVEEGLKVHFPLHCRGDEECVMCYGECEAGRGQWLTEACLSFILSFETRSRRTVATKLTPSTFLIRITSQTHQICLGKQISSCLIFFHDNKLDHQLSKLVIWKLCNVFMNTTSEWFKLTSYIITRTVITSALPKLPRLSKRMSLHILNTFFS